MNTGIRIYMKQLLEYRVTHCMVHWWRMLCVSRFDWPKSTNESVTRAVSYFWITCLN